MSDEPKTKFSDLGRFFIASLPPAFLLLCAVNIVFLWVVLAFMERQMESRLALANRIMDSCLIRKD